MSNFCTVKMLPVALLSVGLIGCARVITTNRDAVNPAAHYEAAQPPQRVDPRLLEKSDKQASILEELAADGYHSRTKYAAIYPVFQASNKLIHGGYFARFGNSSPSNGEVSYYFDAHGRLLKIEKRLPCY